MISNQNSPDTVLSNRPWSQEVQPTQPIIRDNRTTASFGDHHRAQANIHVNEAEINSIVTGKNEEVKVVNEEIYQEKNSVDKKVHQQPETLVIATNNVEEYSPDSDTESLESVELPSKTNNKILEPERTLSPPPKLTRATSTSPLLSPVQSSPPPSPSPPLPPPPSKNSPKNDSTKSKAPPSTPILNTITTSEEFVENLQQRSRSTVPKLPATPPPLPPNPNPLPKPPPSSTSSSRKGSGQPIIRLPSPAKYLPKRKRHWLKGLITLLISLLMFLRQDWLIQSSQDLILSELKEGSFLTQNWANIPIPINLCFYLFGLRNAPEFMRGAKPNLEEHGPFCYIISRKRRILEWKKNSLTYMERIGFEFNEAISQSLDTSFETINMPIFVSVLVAREILNKFYVGFMGSLVYNSIALTLRWSGETWLETITARTFLEARPVPLLAFLHRMLVPLRTVGIPVPDEFGADGFKLANHSFGLTTTLSSGELGPFEVYSKTENGHLLGDIISFKESSEFPGLSAPCNRMSGGDGMFWKRPVTEEQLTIFLQPTCGLLPFVKEYDHLLYGAQVVRYKLDDQWWNMSRPESKCFCNKPNLEDCQGWHDISPCVGGIAPMGFTLPHFYLSPNLADKVEGLAPNPDRHATFLDMEPVLGAPVNAKIGIQGVVAFGPVEQVPLMAKLPRVMFPIMWLQVAAGAEGILGVGLGIGSNFVRYGSWLWLIVGVPLSGLYFYRERRQWRAIQLQLQVIN